MKLNTQRLPGLLMVVTSLLLLNACKPSLSEKDYLKKVSDNLSKIKSATYFSTKVASAPGDTTKFTEPNKDYLKIFVNPADTLIGSSFALYSAEDTTKMIWFYDGKVRAKCYWDDQYVKVDSFQNHPYPFRLVAHYPFYVKINEIIKYSLETEDSIGTDFTDYGDSIHFRLKIYNKHVYFHTKPVVVKNDYIPEDETTQFDIWIRKSDDLPYRMRSNWHHATVWESYSDAKLNTTEEIEFVPADYFPEYFEIVQFKRQPQKPKNDLSGKIAPDWTLKDFNYNEVRLADLESKVLLIQFTGVGCGPCHASLPFLKKLVEDYKTRDFEFVSIETWSKNMEGLKRYYQMNDLNYKFLKSEEDVSLAYEVTSVPSFFILDEHRVIRKVISGYGEGSTDKKIIETIEELL